MIPKFSIVLIAKNEALTLPKLFSSLKDFKARGGEICLLDTGSSDDTINVAQAFGCKTYSGQFLKRIDVNTARNINKRFIVGDEKHIVDGGERLFDFAEARNYINRMASNDMVCTLDADEAYTIFDIDAINALIDQGYDQFEYQFIYAHDQFGRPAVQFVQSKFFDRRRAQWTGIVHEVVEGNTNRKYLDESIIKLEHFQQQGKDHRSNYLPGLALDCYNNPEKDRQSHYFARELMYSGRYKSAIDEFQRHINMNRWPAERAQSMIYMGQCYGHLNQPELQAQSYFRAHYYDPNRRAPLIELALFYRHQDNFKAAAAFAAAALEIPFSDYYANDRSHFENLPHEILYWAKGWLGDIPSAQQHLLKALEYQPYNKDYLRDTKYFFEYPDNGIEGWMRFPELQWLYEQAKKFDGGQIVEVGSWKGKSTHALASGNKLGEIHCIDTWKGSEDPRDATNQLAKQENILDSFGRNMSNFKNIYLHKMTSIEGAGEFKDGSVDMVFIDAGHTKDEVAADIQAWLPKVKIGGIICGHDYEKNTWMTVCEGVDSVLDIDGTCDSIWYKKVTSIDAVLQAAENRPDINRIPKRIITAWLDDGKIPPPAQVQKCIESQKIPGYKHILRDIIPTALMTGYIGAAIKAKKWVKAVDYLRMVDLYNYGGIFLDADVEILPGKNFDDLLNVEMFVGAEVINEDGTLVLGTAVIGAVPGHPLIKEWIDAVEANFKGDDDQYYESSMDLLNKIGVKYQDRMNILPPYVFYPYNHLTGETKIINSTICIHHFMKSWVPKKEIFTIYDLQKLIEVGQNFIFVKRGDGELACMNGEVGENCDGHKYSVTLGVCLKLAFDYLKDKAIIVEFDDQANYNMLLHRTDSDLVAVSDFYKTIGRRHREVFLIGPKKLRDFGDYLDALFIEVPEKNAWGSYIEIFNSIPKVKEAIYLFCAGMPAKVLIADLHKENPEATYIDCGSAFDPSIGQTRTYQISKEKFWSLYQKDNFRIPQARHPERRFALRNIPSGAKIIYDLGCGGNKTMDAAIGIDLKPGATDMTMDISDLSDIYTETADVIISRHSFEHLQDPIKAMKHWIRILKPGGRMIIVLPDHGAINTLDPVYSAGQHLHTYTMESFLSFISLFTDLEVISKEVVLKNWSFGIVLEKRKKGLYYWPKVSFLIPTLGRPEGLKKCVESIKKLDYLGEIEIMSIEGPETVPEKMKMGYKDTQGDIICYAANDIEFTPQSLLNAVKRMLENDLDLVAFNTGQPLPDKVGFCEHFIITRKFVDLYLQGEIFDTRLKHCGVDNLLWAKVKKYGKAGYCEDAIVGHHHFSRGGKMDEVYEKGWKNVDQDRKLLKELLNEL